MHNLYFVYPTVSSDVIRLRSPLLSAPQVRGFPFSVDNKLMRCLKKVESCRQWDAPEIGEKHRSLAEIAPAGIPAVADCAEILAGARLLERLASPSLTESAKNTVKTQIIALFGPELASQMCAVVYAALSDRGNPHA